MRLKSIYTIVTLVLCFNSYDVIAEGQIKINYDTDTDIVDLSANGMSLENTLKQLAKKLDFKVELKTDDVDRKVNLNMRGRTITVLNKLIKPNNVVIFQNGLSPNRVTRVTLLPVGEESLEQKIRASMDPPLLTDNAEDNADRIADYERRVQRKLMGLGRRKFE